MAVGPAAVTRHVRTSAERTSTKHCRDGRESGGGERGEHFAEDTIHVHARPYHTTASVSPATFLFRHPAFSLASLTCRRLSHWQGCLQLASASLRRSVSVCESVCGGIASGEAVAVFGWWKAHHPLFLHFSAPSVALLKARTTVARDARHVRGAHRGGEIKSTRGQKPRGGLRERHTRTCMDTRTGAGKRKESACVGWLMLQCGRSL